MCRHSLVYNRNYLFVAACSYVFVPRCAIAALVRGSNNVLSLPLFRQNLLITKVWIAHDHDQLDSTKKFLADCVLLLQFTQFIPFECFAKLDVLWTVLEHPRVVQHKWCESDWMRRVQDGVTVALACETGFLAE